jgi:RecB family exonuclease
MSRVVLLGCEAASRLERAAAWLTERTESHVTIVGASLDAAAEVTRIALDRRVSQQGSASLGWQRTTLDLLALTLARNALGSRGVIPIRGVALEALAAHVVHAQRQRESLGPFDAIAGFPGFPRALSQTVADLRLAGSPPPADTSLARLVHAFETELESSGFADRARVFDLATECVRRGDPSAIGALVFFDVPVRTHAEQAFVQALSASAPRVFATVPAGDDASLTRMTDALSSPERMATIEHLASARDPGTSCLARLQTALFGEAPWLPLPADVARDIEVFSAPGEHRECVEIARFVHAEAKKGTRFDRMAVLMRAAQYGPHVAEAFRRASIPVHFARGVQAPDPSGRALLTLLACAAEGLSAARFAEYLSLGQVPDTDSLSRTEQTDPAFALVPDEDTLAALLPGHEIDAEASPVDEAAKSAEEDQSDASTSVRTPRHWERLLTDAAVIGGHARWERRLEGLQKKLNEDISAYEQKAEQSLAQHARRDLHALLSLREFSRPIVRELAALPQSAPWGQWFTALASIARRALRHPERVLAILAELQPMADVGPVDITEVRLVLEHRLSQLVVRTPQRTRFGHVYVATIEEARGLSFDVVFVPGLAENMFPQKVAEDPLLLDDARRLLSSELATHDQRAADERLALRLAVGAARDRVVFSYPRVDVEQARPRTPSFYGLEILRVAEGRIGDFHDLATRAAAHVDARLGWPAPRSRELAIDEAEYDLSVLESLLGKNEDEAVGEAHYLLSANAHLARALRFRGRRWLKGWKAADGLVDPNEEALTAIRAHGLDKRSFSPTALQNYAACPYRFLLSAVHRLAVRKEPVAIEDLDPLTRGSFAHEVHYRLLTELRDLNLLPVTNARLPLAEARLDAIVTEVADAEKDRLMPAISRVWDDTVDAIRADVRQWLRKMPEELHFTPAHFELSFGLKDRRAQDARSKDAAVLLDSGIALRGSIDLVERDDAGRLRATDYKTGKVRAQRGDVIKKGEVLQPVFYALTLEKLFPEAEVIEGRLYYCTAAGEFTKVDIPLTQEARAAAQLVGTTIGDALQAGFLPAAPAKDACKYCDFRAVCGPHEEVRTRRKSGERLRPLMQLRKAT